MLSTFGVCFGDQFTTVLTVQPIVKMISRISKLNYPCGSVFSTLIRSLSEVIVPAKRIENLVLDGNVFADFTALSNQHGAANLGQGFPSFGSPKFLSDVLSEVCNGDTFVDQALATPVNLNYQYTKPGEEPSLAKVLSDRYSSRIGQKLDPGNICTTVGAQEALYTTFAAFCNEGDEIVTITPAFDSYFKSAAVLGITVKAVPLQYDSTSRTAGDLKLDIELLRSTLTSKTKILLLNTPSSPLGKVFSRSELMEISVVVQDFPNLLVVSDEVYECMTFNGQEHVHFASLPGMFDRAISIFSAGSVACCMCVCCPYLFMNVRLSYCMICPCLPFIFLLSYVV
jgi:aspartate/methionine/tyrosine aminotransferase